MNFQLIGVNHHTAPVEVRERLAIPESRLPEALKLFTRFPGIDEGLILSTCNRVELVAQTKNGRADLRGFVQEYFHLDSAELARRASTTPLAVRAKASASLNRSFGPPQRAVAQLEEHRSPKPAVGGSSPSCPA